MQFWQTTWNKIQPGDHVRAPDGTVWHVIAVIDAQIPTLGIQLAHGARVTWTDRRPDGSVDACRPSHVNGQGFADAIGALSRHFDVSEVQS